MENEERRGAGRKKKGDRGAVREEREWRRGRGGGRLDPRTNPFSFQHVISAPLTRLLHVIPQVHGKL